MLGMKNVILFCGLWTLLSKRYFVQSGEILMLTHVHISSVAFIVRFCISHTFLVGLDAVISIQQCIHKTHKNLRGHTKG